MQYCLEEEVLFFAPPAIYSYLSLSVSLLADRVGWDTACSDSEGTVENSRCHGRFK